MLLATDIILKNWKLKKEKKKRNGQIRLQNYLYNIVCQKKSADAKDGRSQWLPDIETLGVLLCIQPS